MMERDPSWYESSARERVVALLDRGSFLELLGPEQREQSPHLHEFGLPAAFDDGLVVGCGCLNGTEVLIAAQEGRFMGGAIGEVHGAKLLGLLRAAAQAAKPPRAVLILFDTGGVRLQEANAGELAVARIIRALLNLRASGVPVIGLIGGRAGCFGGGGIIAACCSRLVMSEHGRLGVTGPEVIEANHGVEEFDSADRGLVWRTVGGKHRWLTGSVDRFVDDTVPAFRAATVELLHVTAAFDLSSLEAEHQRLASRLARFGDAQDATEIWARLGVTHPERIPELADEEFRVLTARIRETR